MQAYLPLIFLITWNRVLGAICTIEGEAQGEAGAQKAVETSKARAVNSSKAEAMEDKAVKTAEPDTAKASEPEASDIPPADVEAEADADMPQSLAETAAATLMEIMRDGDAGAANRLKAAQLVYERTCAKAEAGKGALETNVAERARRIQALLNGARREIGADDG